MSAPLSVKTKKSATVLRHPTISTAFCHCPFNCRFVKVKEITARNNMDSTEIGLIAAMPEETASLLKRFPPLRSRRIKTFHYHQLHNGKRAIHLVESGMGPANAQAAARALLDLVRPGLLLSIGFTGAIRPGPRIGDLI